jgi:hypothetical protein
MSDLDAAIRARLTEVHPDEVGAALLAVLDLHKPEWNGSKQICWHCVYPMGGDNVDWPCDTMKAIAAALGVSLTG